MASYRVAHPIADDGPVRRETALPSKTAVAGTKGGTIRAARKRSYYQKPGAHRPAGHARVGEELQLYTGMRTKHCRLIARKTCVAVEPITLVFDPSWWVRLGPFTRYTEPEPELNLLLNKLKLDLPAQPLPKITASAPAPPTPL